VEGVGAVLVFVPLIAILFLAIALLESSGYMARAAFVVDGLMHRVGLHGKSFIPMLMGFGCTVPAIMATRTLESRRDRLATMLVLPLISCGARLPVYALILGAFFPRQVVLHALGVSLTNQALLLFLIYLIGVGMALVAVRLLRKTLFAGETSSFVMELPPYRLPTLRHLLRHIWQPTSMFVRKAGTIIMAVVVIMWVLKTWPQLPQEQVRQFEARRAALYARNLPPEQLSEPMRDVNIQEHHDQLLHSTIGRVGNFIAPVLKPCGFDWKISTALLGAMAAKEVFVGQMGVIYAVHEQPGEQAVSLRQSLAKEYTQLQGFCIMLFMLITSPCMATLAVTWRESGSLKWPAFQWGYLTALAWLVTTAVFQVGRLLGA
jgi:ferrous iron transport protein B